MDKSVIVPIFGVIFFVIVLLILFVILKLLYHSIAFRPSKAIEEKPEEWKEVWVKDRMNGWFFENHQNRPYVLFCHGNSGSMSYYSQITRLCKAYQFNMFVFDYSGYGKSRGYPSVKQILTDGLDAYDWLIESGVNKENIIVMGYSLGGAIATYIAINRPVNKLWLMNTFSSLDKFVPVKMEKIFSALFETFPTEVRIQEYAKKGGKTVIMMSDKDGFIPISHAETLIRNSGGLPLLIQGTHVNPRLPAVTMKAALEYFGYPTEPDFNYI